MNYDPNLKIYLQPIDNIELYPTVVQLLSYIIIFQFNKIIKT